MNPFRQDAAHAIGKWSPVLENENGDLELYIDGVKIEPTAEELILIKEKEIDLAAESKAVLYKALRSNEYSKLNQFELMYDDKVNGTTSWVDAIAAIKNKHPKPKANRQR